MYIQISRETDITKYTQIKRLKHSFKAESLIFFILTCQKQACFASDTYLDGFMHFIQIVNLLFVCFLQMNLLLKEYLISGDVSEAEHCLRDLEVPHFHHELVYEVLAAVMSVLEGRCIVLLSHSLQESFWNLQMKS